MVTSGGRFAFGEVQGPVSTKVVGSPQCANLWSGPSAVSSNVGIADPRRVPPAAVSREGNARQTGTAEDGVPTVDLPIQSSRGSGRCYRIAIFTHEFPALSETFVLDHITHLIDLGHDVHICAFQPRAEAETHHAIEQYDLRRRAIYPDMPLGRLRRIGGAIAILIRADRRLRRILLRSLNAARYGWEAANLNLFYWTLRLHDLQAFDVVHCHFGPIGRVLAFLREIGAIEGKLVTTFHGIDVSAYVRSHPRLYDHLFRRGDLFLPVSDVWARRLEALGASPSTIRVHRMGTDLRRFVYRPPHTAAGTPFRLLTIGRLVEKKGIEFALHAVSEVVRQGYDVAYDVVGDGPLRPELESLCSDLGLDGRVTFHGWQDQTLVARFMAESDTLLAPSVTDKAGDQEGIPVTLMEAMATGLPTVATFHSGIPELVDDGVSGLLVPERDVEAMAARIRRLIDTPSLAADISAAGRAKVEDEHDNAKLIRRLVALYGPLIEDPTVDRSPARVPPQ